MPTGMDLIKLHFFELLRITQFVRIFLRGFQHTLTPQVKTIPQAKKFLQFSNKKQTIC
jgi:hypothetical protein